MRLCYAAVHVALVPGLESLMGSLDVAPHRLVAALLALAPLHGHHDVIPVGGAEHW
jgi:hypothetical protein